MHAEHPLGFLVRGTLTQLAPEFDASCPGRCQARLHPIPDQIALEFRKAYRDESVKSVPSESVITPVIVPGLAANRIKGVRDARAAEGVSDAAGEDDVCPLSMEPIHASTPPPATMNASRDTPNNSNNRTPMSAATTRITNTVTATFIASDRCSAAERPASIRANMAPQMTGFTSDRTVTIA